MTSARRSCLVAFFLLACGDPPMGSDAAVDPGREAGPNDSAIVHADAGPTPLGTAIFVPTPPAYWYVDALPLALHVGGDDVVAYRWQLDGGAMSDETPIATPLTLAAAPAGRRVLGVIGRTAAGTWQTTPTTAAFFMASGASEPTACTMRSAGGTCDYLIGAQRTYLATSTTFLDANHDGHPDYETIFDPAPGARICIPAGNYQQIGLRGLQGTAEQPLTIINCGSGAAHLTWTSAGQALGLIGTRYVRVVGTGDPATPRGIVVASSGTQSPNAIEVYEGSSDIEIAWVEVASAGYAGIVARSNVSCDFNRTSFAQQNTFLHHDYVHDTHGEAFYVGGSHWNLPDEMAVPGSGLVCGTAAGSILCGTTCMFEPELHGVRIYANLTERSDAEGLQVSSAFGDVDTSDGAIDWDTEIYDNVTHAADQMDSAYNTAGMSFQAGTTGRFYRNHVDGTGPTGYAGMFLGGPGHVQCFDNVIVSATSVGIAVQDNDAGSREGNFAVVNNTIVLTGSTEGVYWYHAHSTGNVLENNLILGATMMPIRLNSHAIDLMQDHNVTTGDPTATFASATDYHLRAGAAPIDAGVDTSAYGAALDFDRAVRVGAYDVGAFEYRP